MPDKRLQIKPIKSRTADPLDFQLLQNFRSIFLNEFKRVLRLVSFVIQITPDALNVDVLLIPSNRLKPPRMIVTRLHLLDRSPLSAGEALHILSIVGVLSPYVLAENCIEFLF